MTIYANNVSGTLGANIGPSDTAILLGSGQGNSFPSPAGGAYFFATLIHLATGAIEVVKCTARSVDTLTVVRGQDSTSATSFVTGSVIELRLTAEMLRELDWRTPRGAANGLAPLGADTKLADAYLSANVPIMTAGKINLANIPDSVATDTELALKVSKAGDIMSGVLSHLVGPVNTQQVFADYGHNNNVPRWKLAIESDNALTWYGYDTAGGNPQEGFRVSTANTGGVSGMWVGGQAVWHAGNFNPATKLNNTGPATFTGTLTVTSTIAANAAQVGQQVVATDVNMVLAASGNAIFLRPQGPGVSTGQATLDSGGTMQATNFQANSDRRLKKNIRARPVDEQLVDKLRFVQWDWKADGAHGAGLIAQDVQKVAPAYVSTVGGVLGIDKASLTLEALIGLAARVRKLERSSNA